MEDCRKGISEIFNSLNQMKNFECSSTSACRNKMIVESDGVLYELTLKEIYKDGSNCFRFPELKDMITAYYGIV